MKNQVIKNPGDKEFSDDWNQSAQESNNIIISANITQSAADLEQVAKSVSNYVASADYYTDTGTPTAYIVSPQSPKKAPTIIDEGMRVRFVPANTNTGTATLNVNSLGVKEIRTANGQVLKAGDISAGRSIELVYDGTYFLLVRDNRSLNYLPLTKKLNGLNISNNTTDDEHDIDIAPGTFVDSLNFNAWRLPSILTKQIDVDWAEGNDAGGFPSGLTLTADTWYHVFTIAKSDGTVDGGYDSNIAATNLLIDASAYSHYKRVGSVLTDGSANIIAFTQIGNYFAFNSSKEIVAIFNPSITKTLIASGTPLGIVTKAHFSYALIDSNIAAGTRFSVFSPFQTFTGGGEKGFTRTGFATDYSASIVDDVFTNTNSQVAYQILVTDATATFIVIIWGYEDFLTEL